MKNKIELLGYIGAFLIIINYVGASLGVVNSNQIVYHFVVFLGCVSTVIYAIIKKNNPQLIVNMVIGLFSIIGMLRLLQH
jgi:lipid-A-disaccharide synthase-like uncharacterized protein